MNNEADLHRFIMFRQSRTIMEYLTQDEKHIDDFKIALFFYLTKGRIDLYTRINTISYILTLNHPSINDVIMNCCCDHLSYTPLAIAIRDDKVKINRVQFSLPINQMRYACLIGDLASVQNVIQNYNKNNDIIKPYELVDISCFEFVFVSRPYVVVSRCEEILNFLLEFSCFDQDLEITNQLFGVDISNRVYFLHSVKFLIRLHHLKRNLYHGKVRDFLNEHFVDSLKKGDLWKLKILIRDLHGYLNDRKLFNHALKIACEYGNLAIVEYLMSQNELREKLNYTITHSNNCCIISAALSGASNKIELIKYIDSLDDSNVNLLDDCPGVFKNQDGAFTNYAEKGLRSVIDYIVVTPKYSKRITDIMVENAYIAACRGGHLNLALEILALRSNQLNLENVHNHAFIAACSHGRIVVLQYLLEKEKGVLDYRADNNAALLCAIRFGNIEVVELLLNLSNPQIDYKLNNDEAFRLICSMTTYSASQLINLFLNLRPEVNYNANNGEPLCHVIRNHTESHINAFIRLPNINPSLNNFEALRLALQVNVPTAVNGIVAWAYRNGYQREVRVIIEEANTLRPHNFQINYPQSIHAVSIHHSVSQSGLKLKSLYGHQIDTVEKLCAIIQKLQVEVSALEPSEKGLTTLMISAANRYLANADNPDIFSRFRFKDLKSQLTTQEVIALSYLATQDSTRLLPGCDDKDAITSLVRCFYEAQRGYNIGEDEQDDNNAHDNTICTSGCFNKAIEALNGIHQDVEIVVVTLTQATLKLRKVVEHCTMAYIAQIEKEDALRAKQLVELITADGVVAIWPIIKPNVLKAMHEFAEYLSHGDLSSFGLLIESGIDIGTTAILKQYWLKSIVREQVTVLIEQGKVSEQVLLSVRADDLGELWDIIKPLIEDRVFEKTKEEFPKGREHIEFIHFINKGRMVDLTDLVRKPNTAVTFSPSLKSDEGIASGEMQLRVDEIKTPDSQTLNSPVGP